MLNWPWWHRRKPEWELQAFGWGGHEVFLHLQDGWEPFAITQFEYQPGSPQYLVWFRKRVGE